MFAIDKPMPDRCKNCPEYVELSKTYDEPIGCIHGAHADRHRKDRPADCPLIDLEDDMK